ncbi:MAG: HAMP domain-containing sensor histidine kinase [Thermoanaerobaculia bacterium]
MSFTRDDVLKIFSVLSHDLKSPIFSIDGFSDLLLSDYEEKLDEEGIDFLRRIRASAQQMRKIVDEMSSLLKILARPDAKTVVSLGEIVRAVRMKCNYQIEEGGVEFSYPEDLPDIYGDPEKIQAVITALVSNALTFSDREPGDRRITLTYDRFGEEDRLCVIDNGIGIDERFQAQIFDLGLKLDKSRGDGPGYGLFLARKIAEGHGGSLTVDSKPGEGARFCILLPAEPAE